LNVHELFAHAACACVTVVEHAWPQLPQLVALWLVSTHVPSQLVVEPEQPLAQAYDPPDKAQRGVAVGQTLPHAPQLSVLEVSVSQPSSALVLQWDHGDAHDESGNEHWPALHVTGPLTCDKAVQSCPQVPQL
jgi:hypothetical protein